MINKYKLKHLIHQPENIMSQVTPPNSKTFEGTILPFPQFVKNQTKEIFANNKTTKFVVYRPNQHKSNECTQKETIKNKSHLNSYKLIAADIKISTISETFESVKIKCTNYFNSKAG